MVIQNDIWISSVNYYFSQEDTHVIRRAFMYLTTVLQVLNREMGKCLHKELNDVYCSNLASATLDATLHKETHSMMISRAWR
ncbi:hypothetical protein TNCV_936171 [Trichonephila clavipes]|nr:hypothetical protein TNCV_936171 [Trichonephila clavipes]